MKKLVLCLGAAVLLFGCATDDVRTVNDGIYTSVSGGYSIPLPLGMTPGQNGNITEKENRVSFARFYNAHVDVISFEHKKEITDANRYDLMNKLFTKCYPDRPFVLEKTFPGIQSGTTFAVWPQGDDTPYKPSKIGLAGFWTHDRAIIVIGSLPDILHVLPRTVSEEEQFQILEDIVLNAADSIVVTAPQF